MVLPPLPAEVETLLLEWTAIQHDQAKSAIFTDFNLDFSFSPSSTPPPNTALPEAPTVTHLSPSPSTGLHHIGGLDISFREDGLGDGTEAIAVLAVLSYPSLQLVQSLSHQITLTAPYIPSYLSFRESPHFVILVEDYKRSFGEEVWPQVLMVDGNGRMHARQAGNAVSVGVETGIPTLGVAKEFHPFLYNVSGTPNQDLTYLSSQKQMREICRSLLTSRGDCLGIPGAIPTLEDKDFWGAAIRTSPDPKPSFTNPVFVSSGHKLSLETSLKLTLNSCVNSRVPEPIRVADSLGRKEAQKIWGKKKLTPDP